MTPQDDTIAAIATPVGEGGISVIRLSGASAMATADRGFRGAAALASAPSHTAHHGRFVNGKGETIDEVVATVFKAPRSYTGEDVVEISCHGGMYVTTCILSELLGAGARPADPGEFTRRAFLHGKMDLAQAEAVADLIRARSEGARASSVQQLQGKLSDQIGILRKKLVDLLALVELDIDFAEEDLQVVDSKETLSRIAEAEREITEMIASYSAGKIYRDGIRVMLAGRPNVGKSSILNRFLNTDRAIVTSSPGTTRDTIEESISINGITYILVDTAGLRESSDSIEQEGINRSRREISSADIILFILDLSSEDFEHDAALYNSLSSSGKPILTVGNKSDLSDGKGAGSFGPAAGSDLLRVSAKYGTGFDELRKRLSSKADKEISLYSEKSVLVNNVRHYHCLNSSLAYLRNARVSIENSLTEEFIAVDLRRAINVLGEIIGEVTSDEILNTIFASFCIGK